MWETRGWAIRKLLFQEVWQLKGEGMEFTRGTLWTAKARVLLKGSVSALEPDTRRTMEGKCIRLRGRGGFVRSWLKNGIFLQPAVGRDLTAGVCMFNSRDWNPVVGMVGLTVTTLSWWSMGSERRLPPFVSCGQACRLTAEQGAVDLSGGHGPFLSWLSQLWGLVCPIWSSSWKPGWGTDTSHPRTITRGEQIVVDFWIYDSRNKNLVFRSQPTS